MKKPYQPFRPSPLSSYDFRDEEVKLYWFREIVNEDLDLESLAEENEDAGYTVPAKDIGEMSLADIIHLVPPGVDHSKIKFRVRWPRMMDYLDHTIYYVKPVDKEAKKAEFEKRMVKYNEDMAKFKIELAEYEAWEKQDEIRKLEEKLAKLKKT